MRFIYKIVLGVLLFNAFLIMFAGIFNSPSDYGAVDVTNETSITKYSAESGGFGDFLSSFFLSAETYVIIGIFFGAGAIAKWFAGGQTNTVLLVGIGAFLGIIFALMRSTIQVITNLTDNFYVNATINLGLIVVGLVILFTVIEMLIGQQGVN